MPNVPNVPDRPAGEGERGSEQSRHVMSRFATRYSRTVLYCARVYPHIVEYPSLIPCPIVRLSRRFSFICLLVLAPYGARRESRSKSPGSTHRVVQWYKPFRLLQGYLPRLRAGGCLVQLSDLIRCFENRRSPDAALRLDGLTREHSLKSLRTWTFSVLFEA